MACGRLFKSYPIYLRLLEKDCLIRIHPTGQEADCHLPNVCSEQQRGLVHRQRVQVDDAVQHATALVLQLNPAANGAKIVAQLDCTRGLDTREDPLNLRHGATTRIAWAKSRPRDLVNSAAQLRWHGRPATVDRAHKINCISLYSTAILPGVIHCETMKKYSSKTLNSFLL